MTDLTELFENAARAKYVSTIDLASAYSQVAMSDESKMLTSFRIRRGLFQWNIMSQRLKSSNKSFQALTNVLLGAVTYAKPHQDDIIIRVTQEMHISVICAILVDTGKFDGESFQSAVCERRDEMFGICGGK